MGRKWEKSRLVRQAQLPGQVSEAPDVSYNQNFDGNFGFAPTVRRPNGLVIPISPH